LGWEIKSRLKYTDAVPGCWDPQGSGGIDCFHSSWGMRGILWAWEGARCLLVNPF